MADADNQTQSMKAVGFCMWIPQFSTAVRIGVTFGTMVWVPLTAARPAGAQELPPEAQTVIKPERAPSEPGSMECRGNKCRQPERPQRATPPETPCRGHNPELGPPCASPQR
jgi:hypothetical protein